MDIDKPIEECGIFAILGHQNSSYVTALGLHNLQHRGQEATGITVDFGGQAITKKNFGKVLNVFNLDNISTELPGQSAIGHTRYSTSSKHNLSNIQPLAGYLSHSNRWYAIAHNGQIQYDDTTGQKSDSHKIIELMNNKSSIEDAFLYAVENITGAYSLICLSNNKLLAARDPIGIRPLVLGILDNRPILCSETCALDAVGAKFIREIKNGEIISIEINNGEPQISTLKPPSKTPPKICIFEYIYFSSPHSYLGNQSVYLARKNMGKIIATEAPTLADIVVPVPNTGNAAALGYSEVSNIPLKHAIHLNNDARSFIHPNVQKREDLVKAKHSIIEGSVKGKDIILVDDSMVRGTTINHIISMLRDHEVNKIHLRIASPEIKYPDYYGIDIKSQNELISFKYPNLEDLANFINCDSVAFLSINGIYNAILGTDRNDANPQFTDHYFTGEYPIIY